MLPEGDHGGRIMPGYDYNTTIAEEWHVVPLRQSPGFIRPVDRSGAFLSLCPIFCPVELDHLPLKVAYIAPDDMDLIR